MASVTKYTRGAVYGHIAHDMRSLSSGQYTNPDIDLTRSEANYAVVDRPDPWAHYKDRLRELHVYNRKDVVHAAEWTITAPVELTPEQQKAFFMASADFLNNRYGEKNCICAVVHHDEKNRAQGHMHYMFMPTISDKKHGGEKLCANAVLNKRELRVFHDDFQKHLDGHGIKARVKTGAVAAGQGGRNYSVEELKQGVRERDLLDRNIELTRQIEHSRERAPERGNRYGNTQERERGNRYGRR
ncbi:MAG: plasmid recombination protein [Clostridia bacterium]|nr:plasmid recombination protein [Clostridia bacterium]